MALTIGALAPSVWGRAWRDIPGLVFEVGLKGSGPNGLKVWFTNQSLYEGMDCGLNRGPNELIAIIISITLLMEEGIV